MTRSLQTGLLMLVITMLGLAQLVTVGIVLNASGESRDRAAAERIALAERQVVDAVNRRSAELAHTASRMSLDPDLSAAAAARDTAATARVLERFAGARDTDFALVIAADGELLGYSRSATLLVPSLSGDIMARLLELGAGQPAVAMIGRSPNQVYATSLSGSGGNVWVVSGAPMNDGFSEHLRSVSGATVGLFGALGKERALLLSSSQLTDGMHGDDDAVIERTIGLKTVTGQSVGVRLGIPVASIERAHRELRLQILVLSFGLVTVSALIVAVLLNLWTRSFLVEPLQEIIAAVNRVRGGNYSKAVKAVRRDQIGRLARAVNDMQKEVTEREGRIVHHAQYDALTGLTNRSVVNDKLKAAVGRAQRTGECCAALAIDLSRFNAINDTMGHDVGDLVLKEVARRLASNTSVSDTVARVGGDEFFVIIESIDAALAQHMGEFIASTLESPISVKGSEVHLHAHIGMALFPNHCESPAALRRLANVALSAAKEHGQGVMLYEPGQDEKHLRELAIVHDLPNALQNNEFYIQYQPKIDMDTQQVEHVEALVRWRHPQLGFIPPDEFISLLEKTNSISKLTDWVIKTVVKQSRRWQSKGFNLRVAVNLSAKDLLDIGLAERITMLLRHYVLDSSRLSVEVTESAVMKDPDLACRVLNSLKEIGIKVALDDFGTGQTSLALLKKLPLSELKIDKSFVQNLKADSGDAIIVKSTIDLGHNMGLVVTAEGVENNYTWNLLNSYHCDVVQGYLVSRPMSPEDLEEWYLRLQNRHLHKLDFSFLPQT